MIKGEEIKMTPYEIAEAMNTWFAWPGFTAEWCHKCNVSINTFGHGPGYFCPNCHDYNNQCWSNSFIPHLHPDFGPTLRIIRKGVKIARKLTEKKRRFSTGQRVWANQNPDKYYPSRICPGRIKSFGEAWMPWLTWYYVEFDDGQTKMVLQSRIRKISRYMKNSQPPSLISMYELDNWIKGELN